MSVNSQAKVGKGELKMSPEMLEYFKKYLRNEYASTFVISADGKFALYGLRRSWPYSDNDEKL